MNDLITIARFTFPYQAHLLAGKLEAEGIPAFIRDEESIGLNPMMGNLLGGVKVQVLQSDEAQARMVMETIDQSVTPSEETPELIRVDNRTYMLVKGICPECGSATLYLAKGGLDTAGMLAITLTFGVPVPGEHQYLCSTCGHSWSGNR